MNSAKVNIDYQKPFAVLVFRNGDIGNTVVSEPFFRILKEMFSNIIIHAVFDEVGSSLMQNNPYIDEIFIFNKNKDGLNKKLKLIKRWRKENYLFSFHLRAGVTNELMAFLSGIPNRVGFPLKGTIQFINRKIKKEKNILHHAENGKYLLSIFDKETSFYLPQLYSSKANEKAFEDLLIKFNIEKKNFFVLHPTGKTMERNNWSASFYSELINMMNRQYNLPVIIIGIPNELDEIKKIIGQKKNVRYYFEDNIILKSELIRNSKYFIGNDSGPFHIAECWQIPSVVLYKADDNNFKKWHPLNKNTSLAIFITELNDKEKVLKKISDFLSKW